MGIDLKAPEGRQLLSRLLATTDVFLTNVRAGARARLGIDVDDVREDNPAIVYGRGAAFGPRGPDAGQGGYDTGAYWARSGMQHLLTPPDAPWPPTARPAFGDVVGGLALAGAVGTALYRRAVTGEAAVVDGSLLASGMWQVQHDVVRAGIDEGWTPVRAPDRSTAGNPLMLPYRTADGRFVALMMLAPDRRWPDLCRALGHPELATDPRFADIDARRRNAGACVAALDAIFATRDTAPVQFDGQPGRPSRAPEHGEHTEAVLLDLGLTWDEIGDLKTRGVVL